MVHIDLNVLSCFHFCQFKHAWNKRNNAKTLEVSCYKNMTYSFWAYVFKHIEIQTNKSCDISCCSKHPNNAFMFSDNHSLDLFSKYIVHILYRSFHYLSMWYWSLSGTVAANIINEIVNKGWSFPRRQNIAWYIQPSNRLTLLTKIQ